MKNNYRIIFHDGPEGSLRKSTDVYAESFDEAFRLAHKMPEAKDRKFTEVTIAPIPKEASIIGVCFEYTDTVFKEKSKDFLFIKANSEAEAIEYYNNHFKNKNFSFQAGKTETDGKNVRGRVIETYFAATDHFDADATLEASKDVKSVDELIAEATAESNKSLSGKNKDTLSDIEKS